MSARATRAPTAPDPAITRVSGWGNAPATAILPMTTLWVVASASRSASQPAGPSSTSRAAFPCQDWSTGTTAAAIADWRARVPGGASGAWRGTANRPGSRPPRTSTVAAFPWPTRTLRRVTTFPRITTSFVFRWTPTPPTTAAPSGSSEKTSDRRHHAAVLRLRAGRKRSDGRIFPNGPPRRLRRRRRPEPARPGTRLVPRNAVESYSRRRRDPPASRPDALVVCDEVETDPEDPAGHSVVNPTVPVEVLSPSAEDYDRGEKLAHYKRILSLRVVVLVSHDEEHLKIWRRDVSCSFQSPLPVPRPARLPRWASPPSNTRPTRTCSTPPLTGSPRSSTGASIPTRVPPFGTGRPRVGSAAGSTASIRTAGTAPGGWWILDEPELHLGDDILVPDIAGWRVERLPEIPVPDEAYLTLAPDWACEVLSRARRPSTAPTRRRSTRGRACPGSG